jgi:hypothetical protein
MSQHLADCDLTDWAIFCVGKVLTCCSVQVNSPCLPCAADGCGCDGFACGTPEHDRRGGHRDVGPGETESCIQNRLPIDRNIGLNAGMEVAINTLLDRSSKVIKGHVVSCPNGEDGNVAACDFGSIRDVKCFSRPRISLMLLMKVKTRMAGF